MLQKKIISLLKLSLLLILTTGTQAYGQIMMEKKELIQQFGSNYATGLASDGSEYLSYDEAGTSVEGNEITTNTIYYFKKYRDSIDVCTHFKVIYPSSETPYNLIWLNNKMEYQGNLKWKDLSTGYSYKVQIVEPFFALTVFIDGEGVTETFKEATPFSKVYKVQH